MYTVSLPFFHCRHQDRELCPRCLWSPWHWMLLWHTPSDHKGLGPTSTNHTWSPSANPQHLLSFGTRNTPIVKWLVSCTTPCKNALRGVSRGGFPGEMFRACRTRRRPCSRASGSPCSAWWPVDMDPDKR